jgi:hypothetical protein
MQKPISSPKQEPLSLGRKKIISLGVGLVVIFLLGGLYIWQRLEEKRPEVKVDNQVGTNLKPASTGEGVVLNKRRIAVLPFNNLSEDREQNEYFVDGMTEEMISRLSRIRGLEVIARTSVMK